MNVKCPKCLFEFDAEKNLKQRIDGPNSFIHNIALKTSKPLFKKSGTLDEMAEATLTICPNCQNEFPYTDYKFFGFLSANRLKLLVILFLSTFLLFSIAVLWNDLF